MSRAWAILAAVVVLTGQPRAFESAESSGPILQQFLTADRAAPDSYRALRHLDARTEHFGSSAWMDVWTEATPAGFKYRVVAEGGSESIRNRVFRKLLDAERKAWNAGGDDRTSFTPANYTFADEVVPAGDLTRLGVQARRKDVLLINGALFLTPGEADLVRMEGELSKRPSFWTRRVQVVRHYDRVAGVRVPTALESIADVFLYGRSTLQMQYEYASINGRRVGEPRIRDAGSIR